MAKILAFPNEFIVHPTGWETVPETERMPLSNMGHLMPKIYVLVAEVFELPDGTDKDALVGHLVAGLEFTLSQYPIMAGSLEMDAATGRMWVLRKRQDTASLHTTCLEDKFPTFGELKARDFPANVLAGSILLPASVTAKQLHSPLGDNNEKGIPVATFQLNFISGGLIIAMAVHHAVSDGPGCDGFLTTWAQNTMAVKNGTSFVPVEPFVFMGSQLDVPDPSPECTVKLDSQYPVLKDAGGPMPAPPPGFQMPAMKQQMWHFPHSKAEALKAMASPPVRKGEAGNTANWISTYDAVLAMLFASIARARIPVFQPDLDTPAIIVHAINTRNLYNPPIPPLSLNVASAPARTEPMALRDVIDPSNLPRVAAAVRASIRAMTPGYVTGMMQWVAGHSDKRYLEVSVRSFLGMDLGASSWQNMSSYTQHNFGFGMPSALRWPSPSFDGFVFLYPSRAAAKAPSDDEGIEVCVCLEATCHENLLQDEVLLRFAHPRG